MSSYNTLFILNSTGELEINKIEARKIEEFAVLMKRDTGSKGDADGKKKFIACAEIYYIYLMHDIRSLYYNLDNTEKSRLARKDSKLPDNWKTDKAFEDAVRAYKKNFELTSAGSAYVVAEKAYYTFTRDTMDMQNDIIEMKALYKSTLAKLNARTTKEPMEVVTLAESLKAIQMDMLTTQKKVMENIKMFPQLANDVKLLATKFIEEGGSLRTPVGGGEINNREA